MRGAAGRGLGRDSAEGRRGSRQTHQATVGPTTRPTKPLKWNSGPSPNTIDPEAATKSARKPAAMVAAGCWPRGSSNAATRAKTNHASSQRTTSATIPNPTPAETNPQTRARLSKGFMTSPWMSSSAASANPVKAAVTSMESIQKTAKRATSTHQVRTVRGSGLWSKTIPASKRLENSPEDRFQQARHRQRRGREAPGSTAHPRAARTESSRIPSASSKTASGTVSGGRKRTTLP